MRARLFSPPTANLSTSTPLLPFITAGERRISFMLRRLPHFGVFSCAINEPFSARALKWLSVIFDGEKLPHNWA